MAQIGIEANLGGGAVCNARGSLSMTLSATLVGASTSQEPPPPAPTPGMPVPGTIDLGIVRLERCPWPREG